MKVDPEECPISVIHSKSLGGLVTVRVGLKGVWINDSLVIHQLVTFIIGKGVQFVGFGIPHDLMRFDDMHFTRFLLRLLDFVQHVLTHDIITQLGFAFAVEAEPSHFAFDFALFGFVPIILGTTRHEFFNGIVVIHFTRKLAEVIPQDRVGLSLLSQVNDRVGVIVQDPLPQQFQCFVEAETGPTGGERGHKNVQVGRHGNVLVLVLVVDLHHGVVRDGHVTHVQGIGIQEMVKGLGVVKFFDLGLVETLAELAPHGIQHHFGQHAQPCIVFDLVVLQLDALVLIVPVEVLLAFGFVVPHPRRPPAGFLLDFQPGVDVVSEEPLTGLVKLPHLIDVLDLVPQLDGFLQFGTTPRAGQDALVVGVGALGRSV